jgi:hypothetical protein
LLDELVAVLHRLEPDGETVGPLHLNAEEIQAPS